MRIHSAGSVRYLAPATPSFLWQSGAYQSVGSDGVTPGEAVFLFETEYQVAPANALMLWTKRGQPPAAKMPAFGFGAQTVTGFEVNTLEEAAGLASVQADIDFDFVVIDTAGNQDDAAGLVACVGIELLAGPALQLRNNSGHFSGITRSAQGIYLLDLQSDMGFDASEIAVIATPRGQTYPATMRACAVHHVSDVQKEIRILEDNGLPGSILQDSDVDLIFVGVPSVRPPLLGYPDQRRVLPHVAGIIDAAGVDMKVNSGQWIQTPANPNVGEWDLSLLSAAGLHGPPGGGLIVASVADAQVVGAMRNVQITRTGATDVHVYMNEENGAFPALVADFDTAVFGVSFSR